MEFQSFARLSDKKRLFRQPRFEVFMRDLRTYLVGILFHGYPVSWLSFPVNNTNQAFNMFQQLTLKTWLIGQLRVGNLFAQYFDYPKLVLIRDQKSFLMVAHNCHGKTKNLTVKPKTSRQNQYFTTKAKQRWFCRGYLLLPLGIWFLL